MAEPRSAIRRFLELIALGALALTQPVLETFGDGAEEFVFRQVSAVGVVAFALLIAIAPALTIWLAEQAIQRASRGSTLVRDVFHVIAVAVLGGIAGAQIIKGATGIPAAGIAIGGILCAIAIGFARWREPVTSLVFAVLSFFAVFSVAMFLFASPAADILFDDGTAGAARVEMDDPASVVLIVLDELPTLSLLDSAGAINADRWPTFAQLAQESTWFRNNSGVAPSTPTAVPALLTGRYPTDTSALPVVDEHPQNLFTMLSGTHDLRVHESVTRICPTEVCERTGGTSFVDRWSSLLNDAVDIVVERTRPSRTTTDAVDFKVPQSDPSADRKIGEWLDRLVPSTDLHLDMIHTILPHQPWWRLPSGQRYGGSDQGAPIVANGLDPSRYSWIGDFVSQSARQRHLLQTRFADDQLGVMLDHLRATDNYEDSLIIVTADHGVAFNVGEPIRGLSTGNEAEVMWVPLFVKTPGQQTGAVSDRPTSSVDIVPTVADVLGFALPWEVDGISVFSSEDVNPDVRFFADWRLNLRKPQQGDNMVEVDGALGYERLLEAAPPPAIDPTDTWAFYRFGELGPLLGEEVSSFASGSTTVTASLAEADRYLDVDPAATVVPSYVHGTVGLPVGEKVVVAVNGTIAGWGEVVGTRNGAGWFVVVPATAFSSGPNSIELFHHQVVPGSEGEAALTNIALE